MKHPTSPILEESWDRKKAWKILMENAEEPEEIKDGTGTFTTFRAEYLINDIANSLASQKAELLGEIEEWADKIGFNAVDDLLDFLNKSDK